MQTSILRSFAFVTVGNAALAGRDVSAFWPSELLRFYKQIEFLIARGNDDYVPVAPDPLAWFEKLKALGCIGLRLHNMPMQQRHGPALARNRSACWLAWLAVDRAGSSKR